MKQTHMLPMTPREMDVHDMINRYVRSCSKPPTMRELASILELSIASVYRHIRSLERKGWVITRGDPNTDRRYTTREVCVSCGQSLPTKARR